MAWKFLTFNLLGVVLRGLLKEWRCAKQQRDGGDYSPKEGAPPQAARIMEDEVVVLH